MGEGLILPPAPTADELADDFPTRDEVGGLFKIQEIVLGAASSTIDFSAIPQDFKSLKLLASLRGDSASAFVGALLNVNNDTTDANYYREYLQAAAATASAAEALGAANSRQIGLIAAGTAPANMFGQVEVTVVDYAATKIKPLEVKVTSIWGTGTGTVAVRRSTVVRNNTAAIDRLTLALGTGNFVAGSMASLYGVMSAFI